MEFDNRPVGSNYRLGGGGHNYRLGGGGGGAHIFFFKMTDLCNEQYSIFVQIIGGARPPRAPPPHSYGPGQRREKTYFVSVCEQQRCRSVCAYAQSDQQLCFALSANYNSNTFPFNC